jgi:hypothetical protein
MFVRNLLGIFHDDSEAEVPEVILEKVLKKLYHFILNLQRFNLKAF